MSIQFASHDSRQARVADKQIVVEPDSNRKGLEEFGKVQELPKHQARRDSLSESSSGKGKGPDLPKPEVAGDEMVEIDPAVQQPKGDVNIDPAKASNKYQLTQREINPLTITPEQDAEHRQARSNENFGIGMSSFLGAASLGCIGTVIYASLEKNWVLAGGMGLTALPPLICCLCFLCKILRSKGIIPHTESNLR